jgi:hypothetical protein
MSCNGCSIGIVKGRLVSRYVAQGVVYVLAASAMGQYMRVRSVCECNSWLSPHVLEVLVEGHAYSHTL